MTDSSDVPPFDSLVLEGGGIKGYAYIGALQELGKRDLLPHITNFAGTSVGSIFASLLVAGFSIKDILELSDTNLANTIKQKYAMTSMFCVYNYFGIYSLKEVESVLRDILRKKVDPDVTLSQLFKSTKKELVIVTCCINKKQPVYLHHATFPNVKLIDAIISSISVQFVFQPNKYTFLGQEDYYIDGGVVDNYPLWVFNDMKKLYENKLHEVDKTDIPDTTLGLKLLTSKETHDTKLYDTRIDIPDIKTFISSFLDTLNIQIERNTISESYLQRTIPINTGDIYYMDTELTKEKITSLIESGTKSVIVFLDDDN